MPYNRRYKKSNRQFRRRYVNRRLDTARKALSIANAVRKLVNVEFKNTDNSGTATQSSTATFNALCLPQQGTTKITRIGDSIRLKSVLLRWHIAIHANAVGTHVRLMLLVDKQSNGAVPSIDDILTDSSLGIISPYNIDNSNRFNIVYDRVVKLNQDDNVEIYGKVYKKLDFIQKFDASTGAVSDLTSKALYFIRLSDEATNTPTIQHYTRVRYIDN